MTEVFVVTKDVKHEGTDILGIFEDEFDAMKFAKERAKGSRFADEPISWSSGNRHVMSYQLADVTWVVTRYEVK